VVQLRCFSEKKHKVNTSKNVSTDGVHIQRGLALSKEEEITFSAWDLGGQEVFYPSHQFFLTKNSYYIVVFNVANPDLPRVDYWMRVLSNLSNIGESPSPVILVGTHLDKCTNEVEVLEMMKKRYYYHCRCPGLKHITAVSCATGRGIPQLKEKLLELVKQDKVHILLLILLHSVSLSHSLTVESLL